MIGIEQLSAHEGARLREIRLAALRDSPDAFAASLAEALNRSLQDWTEQLRALPTLVAVINGSDVGMVRLALVDDPPGSAYLVSLWVAPSARGRRAGEKLIEALVGLARECRVKRLLLDVADTNKDAIRLYERMGFERTGETGALPPPRDHILEHQRALDL